MFFCCMSYSVLMCFLSRNKALGGVWGGLKRSKIRKYSCNAIGLSSKAESISHICKGMKDSKVALSACYLWSLSLPMLILSLGQAVCSTHYHKELPYCLLDSCKKQTPITLADTCPDKLL